jgi:hypothetical protein
LCPPTDFTDWALTRLDRASCLLHDGDVSAAFAYGTETLASLTTSQIRGIVRMRARELGYALPVNYPAVSAVREFQELVMAPVRTTKGIPRQ